MLGEHIKKLEHVALLVKDLDRALPYYGGLLGGYSAAVKKDIKAFNVKMATLPVGDIHIDIMEPYAGSPFLKDLEKDGEGLHHICFVVENLDRLYCELQRDGYTLMPDFPVQVSAHVKVGFVCERHSGKALFELKEIRQEDYDGKD